MPPVSEELNGTQSPARPFGFLPARDLPTDPQTIPNPASSPEETELDHGPDSGTDWPAADELDEMPSDESSAGTRSTGSSTKVANPLNGQGLRDTFRNGVILVSHQANQYLARTEAQRELELYLADDQDAENIGDPLARIVGRREGLGQVSPDTADLMAAMMGLAGYATKQIQKAAIASKIQARGEGVQVFPEEAA